MKKMENAIIFYIGGKIMKKRLVLTLLVLVGICWNVAAQRGSDSANGEVEIVDARRNVSPLGKQWAVFIAIDEYREQARLQYPVSDAQEIKNILLAHYRIDEVRELYNRDATAAAIRRLFSDLREKTGPNDSVFVFHAGHGENEKITRTPAWIPYDGGVDIYAQTNWLDHVQIRSMLDALPAKHVFLISDSCFSGKLLDTARGESNETVVNYPAAYDRVSRQAMSSGADETVRDESEFASRLKNALLRNNTLYITPDSLLTQIKDAQTMRPLHTIPILAAIPQSSHQLGGSFLFFRNTGELPPEPTGGQNTNQGTSGTVIVDPQPVNVEQGTEGYFVGSWVATVEHNGSFDTYEITLSANGRCRVKITNDTAQQEADGNWSFDGRYFKLENVTFRNPAITYQRNIRWASIVVYGSGNNAFNIMGRAATNGPPVQFTFFRNN
jgi:hypothetical protein